MRRGGTVSRGGEAALRDEEEAKKLGIVPIDLVVVNLYPFEEGLRKVEAGCEDGVCIPTHPAAREQLDQDLIELIDIGGSTLLRSAAKNHESVTVVCDPNDYERVLREIEEQGSTTSELRRELAAKVFFRTASYDALIAEWLSSGKYHGAMLREGKKLRYGENPHQWGKVYAAGSELGRGQGQGLGVANAEVLQGKEMSYLNYLDADAAWQCVLEFEAPTVVFLKHASPCGVASNSDILTAFRRGYDSDPRSAFGVIIALNRECPAEIVQEILDRKIFTEILLAPSFTAEALVLLRQKENIRVLSIRHAEPACPSEAPEERRRVEASREVSQDDIEYRSITGGVIVHSRDTKVLTKADLKVVTKKQPSSSQIEDLLFAWKVVKHVKSNAIVFAKDGVTVGIGPGQTSRVDATEIASRKAGTQAKGAVMASDAFFPFPDSIEEAAKHGIAAIIQPGGSIRDQEVFAKADELGVAMVVTGIRAFRH